MKLRIPMIVAVRSFVIAEKQEATKKIDSKRRVVKRLKFPSSYTLVLDTETTVDHLQNMRFGTYQVRQDGKLVEKGLFYEPTALKPGEARLVRSYCKKHALTLRERISFLREVFYRYGYDRGGLIVGFNVPFDLSRLASNADTSHGFDMRGGFSLELLPEKWMPNVLVRHLNSRAAFIRFAAAPKAVDSRSARKKFKTQAKAGYFLDVKTLASALMGGCGGLGDLARALEVPSQKMESGEHGGPLTSQYLDYAVNDAQTTWECFQILMAKYREHNLTETPPQRIYSEASLGKAYLKQMQITSWRKMQPDFAPELLGIIMNTYYGGRAEIRIRRQKVRVLYCDFRSMYPTVCTLMGLWQFVIASGIDHEEWTGQTRELLDSADISALQHRDFWKSLHVLVEVAPEADIYPVRSHYGENSRTIGLNGLTSAKGHWYTLADCIASKLHSGKAPAILQAIRFTPREPQEGLKDIEIGSNAAYRINPYHDDFYKRVIELRGQVQARAKRAIQDGNLALADQLESYSLMLKLLANSTSYGIFAEINVQSYNRPRRVTVYGSESTPFAADSRSVEEVGTAFHPLLATLITGAARLMLATAERLALDNGIGWALCDTDSLALARPDDMADVEFLARAQAVTQWFDSVSPYDDGKPLFKVEDQNYRIRDGQLIAQEHEPLYAVAISAKRYVLFNLETDGKPIIRKALAHGLGHLLPPYQDREAPAAIPKPTLYGKDRGKPLKFTAIGVDRWQYDVWYQIIMAELDGHPDEVDLSILEHLDRKAASRYSAATSPLLHWFDGYNDGKPYSQRVKCFNFMLGYQFSRAAYYEAVADGEFELDLFGNSPPSVVAPYDTDPERALSKCFDRRTGKPVPPSILATYRDVLADYHLHSESKFHNGELFDRGETERFHVEAIAVEYIGKEAHRLEEQYFLGEMPDAQIEYGHHPEGHERLIAMLSEAAGNYGPGNLADKAGLSRQQLHSILHDGAQPKRGTVIGLCRALRTLRQQESVH